MTDITPTNLIVHAIDKKPVDFQQTFDDLIKGKLQDAIEVKKAEIAKTIFNKNPDEEEEFLEPLEVNDDDVEEVEVPDFEEQEADLEDEKNA